MSTELAKYGAPCFLGMHAEHRNGDMYDFAVDGHPGVTLSYADLVGALEECDSDYTPDGYVYLCVPLKHVTEASTDKAPPPAIEVMSKVADALEDLGIS